MGIVFAVRWYRVRILEREISIVVFECGSRTCVTEREIKIFLINNVVLGEGLFICRV